MTVFDSGQHIQNEGHDPNTAVDAGIAAQTIGSVLHALINGGGSGAGPPGTGPDVLSQTPSVPSAPSTGTTTQTQPGQAGVADGTFVDPVPKGTGIAQGYHGDTGGDPNAGPGDNHPGVDLSVPVGTTLVAANAGVVSHAANDDPGGYGRWVEITSPNGLVTRYGHMSATSVTEGQQVKAGDPIGASGGAAGADGAGNSSGPHLHFEVHQGGNTVDPIPYLAGGMQITNQTPGDVAKTTTTPASQEAQLGSAVTNVGDVLTGKGAHDQPGNTTTTTPGQPGQAGVPVSAGDGDPKSIDSFLAATRQHESGGDYTVYNQSGQSNASGAYQFLNSTWKGAGGSTEAAAQATPAEQDAVARRMALALFDEFHSWRLVAAAWYGGPGVAQQMASGQDAGSPQGQGSYKAYADTIARMMTGE